MLRFATGDDIAYGHPGGAPGVASDFRATRNSGWAVIAFANDDAVRLMPLADDLAGIVAKNGGPDLRLPMP